MSGISVALLVSVRGEEDSEWREEAASHRDGLRAQPKEQDNVRPMRETSAPSSHGSESRRMLWTDSAGAGAAPVTGRSARTATGAPRARLNAPSSKAYAGLPSRRGARGGGRPQLVADRPSQLARDPAALGKTAPPPKSFPARWPRGAGDRGRMKMAAGTRRSTSGIQSVNSPSSSTSTRGGYVLRSLLSPTADLAWRRWVQARP